MSKISQMRELLDGERVKLYALFRPMKFEFTNPETGQLIVVDMGPSPMPESTFNEIDATLSAALCLVDEMEAATNTPAPCRGSPLWDYYQNLSW